MKRLTFYTVCSVLATICIACIPTAGTRPPDFSNKKQATDSSYGYEHGALSYEKMLYHCSGRVDGDLRLRAFGATLLSLNEREWTTERMDSSRAEIVAKIYYRNRPEYSARARFQCDERGRTMIWILENHPKLEDDMQQWLVALEQSFSKFSCYTDEALRTEMNKFGLSF